MTVSIEIPVFKHFFLEKAIKSVLNQTYKEWKLLLLSDGVSVEAQRIMRDYAGGKVECYFQEHAGIGKSRNKLTSLSDSDFIVPMDDDDMLMPNCLEDMVNCIMACPRAGIVRARRKYIDEEDTDITMKEWFPFGPRTYFKGMTIDVRNHSQPYMISRSIYDKTAGWEGIDEFNGAGEDCDIFLKIEEIADVVLLDKILYDYRIHKNRFSLDLGKASAQKMWCYLADKTIARRGLNLRRKNAYPPFKYEVIT